MGAVRDAALWAVTLIAIAIAIAAGTRIVEWIVAPDDATGIYRAAVGLLVAAIGGGAAIVGLTNGKEHK